ncbi:18823_t:CDS:2, partial [Gigaspora rosea]
MPSSSTLLQPTSLCIEYLFDKTHARSNWDPRWIKEYPWLDRRIDSQDKPELFYYLDKHIGIKEHKKAMEKYTNCQPDLIDIMSSFTIQAEVNKLDIIAKMHCIYLCAKKHLAIEAFSDLMELTNLQIQNKTELVYNKSPITVSPPIFGPKRVISDTAPESLLSNQSILIDESNTITHDKTCAIVSKHIVQNILVLRYLGLIELGETNTEAITNNLKNFFIAKMLDTQKLMHFGSDGASVMIENKTGVATRLKEVNPFMTNCHCIAHRLNLVGKDSAEEISYFKNYEVVLKEIYAYFATSHQKWQHLKLFQSLDNEDPQLAILHIVSTRWLSLSNAVSNLYQIIFSIKDALYDEAFNDPCAKTRQRAKALYDDIDSEFILATKYLANILSIISKLTKIFQSDYVALSDVYMQLNVAIESIILEFIGYEDDDIRFPDIGIYNAMRIFDFSQIPVNTREIVTFGENEIQLLAEFYGKFKQHNDTNFSAKVNRIELLKEWREAKLVLKNYKELGFVEGWKRIFDSSQFVILYPN